MLMANTDRIIQDAVSKMVAELKALGFDPLIDINSDRIGIIIPVEQLVNKITRSVPNSVYKHIDLYIEEKTLGTKGFIVIKVKKKQ
jgi:hypothetical protein